MIKLLIVDDEFVVRQGIRHTINWDKLGVYIVGDTDNAVDAIKQANRMHPDIILCDIRLPGENGFTVINTLKETLPNAKFILISGYADQQYMLDAIRYGVCDYLLKPLNMTEIQNSVIKVCRQIHIREEEERLIIEQNKFLLDNLDTLRTHFINNLLKDEITPEQLKKNISSLNLSLEGPNYVMLLAKAKTDNISPLIQDFAFIFREYSPIVSSLQKYNNLVVTILNTNKQLDILELDFITKTFLANSENLNGIVAVSPLCNSPLDLKPYLNALIDLNERGFWYNKGHFCFLNNDTSYIYPKEKIYAIEHQLIKSIKEGKSEKIIKQSFDELLSIICDSRPTLSVFQEEMNNLFQAIYGIIGSENRETINICSSVLEVRKKFAKICNLPSVLLNKYGSGLSGKALQYIGLHFNEDISLEQVASELYISPSYLSRILKEKTNSGFQDWLHCFRINKAKELLSGSDYSISKIADLCGYNSYKLLSEHFRRITGLTSTEYRIKYSSQYENLNSENFID